MGGVGYIFIGENDVDIMYNFVMINFNVFDVCYKCNIKCVFYLFLVCMYLEYNQFDFENLNCFEDSVYLVNLDSEYGWEKLFFECFYLVYNCNYGM